MDRRNRFTACSILFHRMNGADADAPRLETLFEATGLPSVELPEGLRAAYGGGLGFPSPVVYANFVETLDGVVAFGDETPPSVISGKSRADRLVMGLLRACASAVVIGAGTLRNEMRHLWTPEYVYPPLAEDFRQLRIRLGLTDTPKLVVLTRSGRSEEHTSELQSLTNL